jgi:DNA-binding response OmpR family regulator
MSATLRQKSLSELQPAAINLATPPRQTQVLKKKSKTASTVLIADADPSNLAFLTKLIEKEGFAVLVANDGREARKILQHKSDFIAAIFKAVIPHVSGPDLVRYMRREKQLKNIPVIMMTQADSIRILCESFAAGAVVLLPEPFSASQIQNLLHMLVDIPRRERTPSLISLGY